MFELFFFGILLTSLKPKTFGLALRILKLFILFNAHLKYIIVHHLDENHIKDFFTYDNHK